MNRRNFPFLAIGFYLITIAYPIIRIRTWYEASHWLDALIANGLTTLLVILPFAFLLARSVFRRRFPDTGQSWFLTAVGICFLTFPIVVVIEFVRLVPGFPAGTEAFLAVISAALLAVYSFWRANSLSIQKVNVDAQDQLQGKSIVQISDVHIGSRSSRFLRSIVKRVNQLNPNWLVITGDLIDSHRTNETQLEALRSCTSKTYMVMGNHERYEGLERVTDLVEQLGIRLLRNEQAVDGAIQFIGIDDNDTPGYLISKLEQFEPDPNRFKVLLYHRPHALEEAADWGFDLMLSGHTHRGQIFPFIAVVKRFFKLTHGTHQIGDMTLHISMGTGTWGPILRLGSRSEITHIRFT